MLKPCAAHVKHPIMKNHARPRTRKATAARPQRCGRAPVPISFSCPAGPCRTCHRTCDLDADKLHPPLPARARRADAEQRVAGLELSRGERRDATAHAHAE